MDTGAAVPNKKAPSAGLKGRAEKGREALVASHPTRLVALSI